MLSIEDAFKVLGEACWWETRTDQPPLSPTDEEREFIGAEKDAARALALAVLE